MHSVATRGVTVVTIMTLIFTPVWKGNRWVSMLTGKNFETKIEACQPGDPCPTHKHITERIELPAPDQPPVEENGGQQDDGKKNDDKKKDEKKQDEKKQDEKKQDDRGNQGNGKGKGNGKKS